MSDKHQLQARTDKIDIPFSCLGSQSPGICFTVSAVGVTLYKVGNYLHYHAVHSVDSQNKGALDFVFANGRIPVGYGPGISGQPGKIWIDSRMGPGVRLEH
ncbi:uncharacterized protein VDAG_05295 [Verticillium dahliae VdLs.17]|uniref:Uncharacterized protein n=1 Tax=Verticillium dahliae (strain VdLs.17 / ATCC MYA-4575 / FGSC 10137) TaxID=498257 RepID=G2X5X9_VERDV|nr:uncharacterized protein VDAG_05295 [Verticillium dahliae VdLs.17]EGY14131.1 hypothetical protein VDAG_05295 [Verticillium dahliae VdLs.17]KAH6672818.1 hypothetical protein EV126DRAFT_188193 [Verticillium dahliae]KAH6701221.1 hypothetical protein EV126DRAFT_258360 [Verticillium dahliae]